MGYAEAGGGDLGTEAEKVDGICITQYYDAYYCGIKYGKWCYE